MAGPEKLFVLIPSVNQRGNCHQYRTYRALTNGNLSESRMLKILIKWIKMDRVDLPCRYFGCFICSALRLQWAALFLCFCKETSGTRVASVGPDQDKQTYEAGYVSQSTVYQSRCEWLGKHRIMWNSDVFNERFRIVLCWSKITGPWWSQWWQRSAYTNNGVDLVTYCGWSVT